RRAHGGRLRRADGLRTGRRGRPGAAPARGSRGARDVRLAAGDGRVTGAADPAPGDTDGADVLVAGSGAAGLAAALAAAQRGARVLMAERGDAFGGTTALSGG